MINRYSRKELTHIWSEESKYKIWLDVEIAAAQAMEKLGQIPKGVSSTVRRKARINVARIHAIEAKVKHDVIAFLTSVTEKAGINARYLHQGMTSSDVLDTSFNIQLVQSGKILLKDIDVILKVLKRQAKKYKFTPCIGRSHGIHAEPITFGLKLASFYEEFKRNRKRLADAIDEVSSCAISGAVGTFANINPNVEKHVAKKLGLKIVHEFRNENNDLYGYFLSSKNNTFLEFFKTKKKINFSNRNNHFKHICFEVSNLKYLNKKKFKNKFAIKRGKTDKILQFFTKDFEGNIVEFHQRDRLSKF